MSKLSVCVYCGSRPGVRPAYTDAAAALGQGLAARNWRLVYGAGDVGLMGSVARSAHLAGGETFGVIPVHLVSREIARLDLSTYVVTETMHERKKVMLMNADAVVLLPGGAGSLDEFFEALTWRQLGLHDKPIVAVNTQGYWTRLTDVMAYIIDEGFADKSLMEMVQVVPDAQAALDAVAAAV